MVGCDDDQKEQGQMFAELLLEGARAEEERAGQAPQDIPFYLPILPRQRQLSYLRIHILQCASAILMNLIHMRS